MMFGDETTKAAAIKFIRGIMGRGNTRHLPALQQALRLAPDVVFFLTDAVELRDTAKFNDTGAGAEIVLQQLQAICKRVM